MAWRNCSAAVAITLGCRAKRSAVATSDHNVALKKLEGDLMPDNWIEISAKTGNHITYMMPAPGGALIRHIELVEDSIAVSVSICFVPNAGGQGPLQPDQF